EPGIGNLRREEGIPLAQRDHAAHDSRRPAHASDLTRDETAAPTRGLSSVAPDLARATHKSEPPRSTATRCLSAARRWTLSRLRAQRARLPRREPLRPSEPRPRPEPLPRGPVPAWGQGRPWRADPPPRPQ